MDTQSDREPTPGSPWTRTLDEQSGAGPAPAPDHERDRVTQTDTPTAQTAGLEDATASTAEQREPDGAPFVGGPPRVVPIGAFAVPGVVRPIPQPDGWTDVLTGTDGPRLWDRTILSEQARAVRYRRPVTVAFAEIVGLDHLAGLWGWDVAERTLAACARRLGREIRSSDHIARLEQARFGMLLTETEEIAAINFVERARASCERELAAVGNGVATGVVIGFGWASPPDGGDLSDAVQIALARLAAELPVDPPVDPQSPS